MAAPEAPVETMRRDYMPPSFLAPSIDLAVKLTAGGKDVVVGSKTAFRVNPEYTAAAGSAAGSIPDLELDADLKAMTVTGVAVNGTRLADDAFTLDTKGEKLVISGAKLAELAPDAATGGTFTVETSNLQHPVENKALEGLYMSQGDYCTQMEAQGFRRFVPHLDRPDVLSLYTCSIEAPASEFNELLSNGNRAGGGSGPIPAEFVVGGVEPTSSGADLHWARWEHPVPKPSYLFALVAGQLASLDSSFTTMSGREVTLRLLAKAEDLSKCGWAMTSLKQSMAWDEQRYGREYDLDIFHIVAVASFSMGAMENSSLNVFNVKYVLADERTATDTDFSNVQGVIGHEYFHNWSGNRVTCRDWFQLSLKEGFTVFRDQEFSSDMASRTMKRISAVDILRAYQFAEAAGPMSHPVRPASFVTINNFYSVTVYNGGAEVVRMYPTIAGRAAFRRGTDEYFARHDGQAVTCDDFCSAIEEANWPGLPAPDASAERAPLAEGEEEWIDPPFQRTGERPLTQFRRWYSVGGTPQVDAAVAYDAAGRTLTVTLKQSVPATAKQPGPKPPLHIPIAVGFLGADGADLAVKLRADPAAWDQKWGAAMAPTEPDAPEAGRDAEMFPGSTTILHLTQASQTFVFEDVDFPAVDPAAGATTPAGLPVPSAPVPSLLRGFSAPVRLTLEGDDTAARLFRLAYDADPFNRYEASNLLATDLIVAMVPAYRAEAAAAAGTSSTAAGADGDGITLTAGAGEAATAAFCDAVNVMLLAAVATASGSGPAVDAPGGMDPALVATILALPPHKSLLQECAKRDGGVADPRAVLKAKTAMRSALAERLSDTLQAAYKTCTAALEAAASEAAAATSAAAGTGEGPLMSAENKARRALRNAALGLLISPAVDAAEAALAGLPEGGDAGAAAEAATAAGDFDAVAAAQAQMAAAANMTEEMGAFGSLVRLPAAHPARAAAVEAFYAKWKGENLVEDKWLSAQAASGDVGSVRALLKHEAFDLMVPNKVYSVVRVFSEANVPAFYAADGSGFELLADVVGELDPHAPQVAARIATSFTAGRSLPPGLAATMKASVDRLMAAEGTSKDLSEVLGRCAAALEEAIGGASA